MTSVSRNFGGVIWTNHALERLKQRGISQGDAWATWRRPDQERYAASKGAWVYYRTYGNRKIEVAAKQTTDYAGKKQWIILSVWSKQVFKKQKQDTSLLSRIMKKLFSGLFGR